MAGEVPTDSKDNDKNQKTNPQINQIQNQKFMLREEQRRISYTGSPQQIFSWVGQANEKRHTPKRFSKE